MYTYQDITMACNESSDCSTATGLFFVRSIITVSKLCLHFAHLRFSKPSSSFNVIPNESHYAHETRIALLGNRQYINSLSTSFYLA